MTASTRRGPRLLRIVTSLAALLLLSAACGGSGDADASVASQLTLASLDDAAQRAIATPTDENDRADEALTFEEAQLEFAACMRETYPEWPDPDPDAQGGRLGFGPDALGDLGIDFEDEDFRDSLQHCQEQSFEGVAGPDGGLSPEEQAELEDNLLALFACVRETPGYEDIPDPDFSGGPGGFGFRQLFEGGDIDPAEFREVMQTCQAELGIEEFGGPGRRRPAPAGS